MIKTVGADIAKSLMFCMKRIRAVEETIATRYPEGKMRCPTHLCTGQEAVSAGVGGLLRKDDFAVSTHRAHGHYLAKGGDLKRMMAEIYGKSTGCSSGKGGSMHLIDLSVGFMGSTPIVGGTIPVGTGIGFSISLHGTDQISCVFLGDGAVEEGVFFESINFAALKNLPVLYICENNFYSVYSPLSVRQPAGRNNFELVRSIGVRSDSGDGNDVMDVYAKTDRAIRSIRAGDGPYFLEFATYRWREHCGPQFDNDIGYRTEEEYLKWKDRDPIALFEAAMKKECASRADEIAQMDSMIAREVADAFHFAETSPFPSPAEISTHLYSK
jgi:TPP-dependent pyruvate/acetoin dehydrogenase alpha subunit